MSMMSPAERGTSARPGLRVGNLMFLVGLVAIASVLVMKLGWLVLFFAVPVAGAMVLALLSRRTVQVESLLSVLAIAARRRMPLGPGLAAFADLCRGLPRRRALAVAYLLETGAPLGLALARVPRLFPNSARVLATVGDAAGAVPEGLEQARQSLEARRESHARFAPKLTYLCVVLLAMQAIGGYYVFKVAPRMEAIFADYGMDLPVITKVVLDVSHTLMYVLPFLVVLELAALIYMVLAFFGWVSWSPAVVSRLFPSREIATILRGLSVGVGAGVPIEATMRTLQSCCPSQWIRRRVALARLRTVDGENWTAALAGQGLLNPDDAAVLDWAQRAGNLPWALATLAESKERRLAYRLDLITQFVFPLIILGLGVIVLCVSAGYFLPLVRMIRLLAG